MQRVKLDNRERGYYSSLHQQVDSTGQGASANAYLQFLKRSLLPGETLKQIWQQCAVNNTLDREQFYLALKLISYAQNNIAPSLDNVAKNIASPLPTFDDPFKMKPEQIKLYQGYATQLDLANEQVNTEKAMALFRRSQLPQETIQSIVKLVGMINTQMSLAQFTVITHLIALATQGITTNTLPQVLMEHLNQRPKLNTGLMDMDLLSFDAPQSMTPGMSNKYSAFDQFAEPIHDTAPKLPPKVEEIPESAPVRKSSHSNSNVVQQQISNPISKQYQTNQLAQVQALQQENLTQQNQLKESVQQEEILLQQNISQTNELLVYLREQNERQLQQSQAQLDYIQRTNESYRTLIKKISDENDIFNDELKQLEVQKKKAFEILHKQAHELSHKYSVNLQLKQNYIQQSQQGTHQLTEFSSDLLKGVDSLLATEQDLRKKIISDVVKEFKQTNDKIEHLGLQIQKLDKKQTTTSAPYVRKDIEQEPIKHQDVQFQNSQQSHHLVLKHVPQIIEQQKIQNQEQTEQFEPKQDIQTPQQQPKPLFDFSQVLPSDPMIGFQQDLLVNDSQNFNFNNITIKEEMPGQKEQFDDYITYAPTLQEAAMENNEFDPQPIFQQPIQQQHAVAVTGFEQVVQFTDFPKQAQDQNFNTFEQVEFPPKVFNQAAEFPAQSFDTFNAFDANQGAFFDSKKEEVQIEFDSNAHFPVKWSDHDEELNDQNFKW